MGADRALAPVARAQADLAPGGDFRCRHHADVGDGDDAVAAVDQLRQDLSRRGPGGVDGAATGLPVRAADPHGRCAAGVVRLLRPHPLWRAQRRLRRAAAPRFGRLWRAGQYLALRVAADLGRPAPGRPRRALPHVPSGRYRTRRPPAPRPAATPPAAPALSLVGWQPPLAAPRYTAAPEAPTHHSGRRRLRGRTSSPPLPSPA
ncbi:hypothetical protein CBM2589_B190108 [Cupriavidus taiwanensis]|uniref:Uncharacterized protein n=1 Tax=Cupriavidus taiwanensis TaxID=164546 RepID=A0A975WX82_9BURK|nr:hypothetical protein CBM2589_B190108 [Cupriavidus taiwanensis]